MSIMKKGFYKWNKTDKKFELIEEFEKNTWILTDTFDGIQGEASILYILSQDCVVSGVSYKKGFYTWNQNEGFVIRSGASEVYTDTRDLSDYYTKTQADNRFEILTNKVNTITSASTTDEYPSAKATFDYAAPLASAYSIATTSTADSNCVFNMRGPASGSYRIEETRIIADASMINPIQGGTSANSWGIMKVNQTFLTDPNRVYIEQIFTAYYTDSKQINDKSVVFRRTGSCNATGLLPANIYDNRANITWKPWYPVEYPNTNATLTPVGSNYRVSCSARFNVTGGVLTFAIENINISYTDTSQSISPTSSSFQFKIDQLQTNIPFKTSQAIYSSLYKEPRESTDSKSEMALIGITNESGLCYLRCYWMHPSITYQYTTGRYAGHIIQNLGY